MRCCLSSPIMLVLMNGSPTSQFSLQKGLYQGDPLSPFLFNIVVEALNRLFLKAYDIGLIRGAAIGGNSMNVTHLQFIDDTILFLEAKVEYVKEAKCILGCFELASNLKINFHKSCLVKVGKTNGVGDDFAEIFRCKNATLPITYLGMPLGTNPKSIAF